MSKYKVGDKFIIEIADVKEHEAPSYNEYISKSGIWLTENTLGRLHKVDSNMKIEDINDMIAEYDTEKKGYNRGLQDAWELAQKIYKLKHHQRSEVLGINSSNNDFWSIMSDFTPQEALAKYEAYEKEQEIQVGDVVRHKREADLQMVVVKINGNSISGFNDHGVYSLRSSSDWEKTGKHIDIQAVLQEIGGEIDA